MKNSWKIFRTVSLLEIIATCVFFAFSFFMGGGVSDTSFAGLYFMLLLAIPLIMIVNCLSNVFMLPILFAGESVAVFRMVAFWILWMLFLLCITIMSISLYFLIDAMWHINYPVPNPILFQQKVALVFLLLMVLFGIYLLVAQIWFYFQIKKAYERRRIAVADEIGLPEEA